MGVSFQEPKYPVRAFSCAFMMNCPSCPAPRASSAALLAGIPAMWGAVVARKAQRQPTLHHEHGLCAWSRCADAPVVSLFSVLRCSGVKLYRLCCLVDKLRQFLGWHVHCTCAAVALASSCSHVKRGRFESPFLLASTPWQWHIQWGLFLLAFCSDLGLLLAGCGPQAGFQESGEQLFYQGLPDHGTFDPHFYALWLLCGCAA